MIFTLILIISLLLLLTVFMFRLIKILRFKINVYEQWIVNFKKDVENTLDIMREIDNKGTFATSVNDKGVFESDDQVGQIFKELLNVMEELNVKIQ